MKQWLSQTCELRIESSEEKKAIASTKPITSPTDVWGSMQVESGGDGEWRRVEVEVEEGGA